MGVWVGLAKLSYPRSLRSETRGGKVRDIAEDVRRSLCIGAVRLLSMGKYFNIGCVNICAPVFLVDMPLAIIPDMAAIADRSVRVPSVWAFGEVAAMLEFGNARSTSSQKMLSFAKRFQRFETLFDLQEALWIACRWPMGTRRFWLLNRVLRWPTG